MTDEVRNLHRWIWCLENALIQALIDADRNPDLAQYYTMKAAKELGMPDLVRPHVQ